MYNRLLENLSYLKLSRISEILDNYLERALKENVSLVDSLDYLFEEQKRSKSETALLMSTQMAGFPSKKTLEQFDFSFQPSIDTKVIDDLRTMRFIHNTENLIFLGPPGVGKTHLAVSLGLEAIRNRLSVYYVNCHDLVNQLNKDKLKVKEIFKIS